MAKPDSELLSQKRKEVDVDRHAQLVENFLDLVARLIAKSHWKNGSETPAASETPCSQSADKGPDDNARRPPGSLSDL